MPNATFSAPDMTTYCGLEELGLVSYRRKRGALDGVSWV